MPQIIACAAVLAASNAPAMAQDAPAANAAPQPAPNPAAMPQPAANPAAAPTGTTAPAPVSNSPASETAPAPEPEHRKSRSLPLIGVDGGLYMPTSSKTRDRLGSTWTSFGLGIGGVGSARRQGALNLDFQVLYNQHNGNSALIIPIGVEYRKGFAQPGQSADPYVSVGIDADITDFGSHQDNIDQKVRVTEGAYAALGITFSQRAFLDVRYRAISSVKGFDLSGTELSAGIRF
jgi:hypothetical protein